MDSVSDVTCCGRTAHTMASTEAHPSADVAAPRLRAVAVKGARDEGHGRETLWRFGRGPSLLLRGAEKPEGDGKAYLTSAMTLNIGK